MTRFALALAALALVTAARAADLPTGTWAVNVDDNKGELVIKDVKDGKVSGILLGSDFTGTWDGKELRFHSGAYTYDAQLVREPGEKGLTKYTLTGARSTVVLTPNRAGREVHVNKAGGWYAQLSTEAPRFGEIKAEVRGVLKIDGQQVYVVVKRKVGADVEETRIWANEPAGDTLKQLLKALEPLDGQEVVVNMPLGQMKDGTLYFVGKFAPKSAAPPK